MVLGLCNRCTVADDLIKETSDLDKGFAFRQSVQGVAAILKQECRDAVSKQSTGELHVRETPSNCETLGEVNKEFKELAGEED